MKTQSVEVLDLKNKIAIARKLIWHRVKTFIWHLMRLEEELEAAIARQWKQCAETIELVTHRRKNMTAHLCRMLINPVDGSVRRGRFYGGKPKNESDNINRYWDGHRAVVEFTLDAMDSGIYEYRHCPKAKEETGFMLISSGKVILTWC